jgi:hypothetical protein
MEPVGALTAAHRGQWLVSTRNTKHVFDLDASTYRRLPGSHSGAFPDDGRVMRLTRVDRWPAVGGTFFIWLDAPDAPDLIEYWRQSSSVRSIEPVLGDGRHTEEARW